MNQRQSDVSVAVGRSCSRDPSMRRDFDPNDVPAPDPILDFCRGSWLRFLLPAYRAAGKNDAHQQRHGEPTPKRFKSMAVST
jgi:hypothetical protein